MHLHTEDPVSHLPKVGKPATIPTSYKWGRTIHKLQVVGPLRDTAKYHVVILQMQSIGDKEAVPCRMGTILQGTLAECEAYVTKRKKEALHPQA